MDTTGFLPSDFGGDDADEIQSEKPVNEDGTIQIAGRNADGSPRGDGADDWGDDGTGGAEEVDDMDDAEEAEGVEPVNARGLEPGDEKEIADAFASGDQE